MPALDHFLALAQRGRLGHDSSDETAAAQLSRVVMKQVPHLDDYAIGGLIEFIRAAKDSPESLELIMNASTQWQVRPQDV